MRWKIALLSCLSIVQILYSCDSNRESSDTLDYALIKSELLKDSSLHGKEQKIESIFRFYQKELPHQFSQRIQLNPGDEDAFFLDVVDTKVIDSFRDHLMASTKIHIEEVADTQILDETYLLNNIRYALTAVEQYPWNQTIPDSIFLNYLLPYKVIQEYPGTYWSFLEPYYRDSLSLWASPSYTGFDARDARWIQRSTALYPGELPMWWNYDPGAQTFTKYPSLPEILLLQDGGCYLEALINVMILRTCGIPATVYEVPYWGSRNGSHAGDAFWSSQAQKMVTRYSWVTYDPEYYVRPAKVLRYTYRYTGAYTNHIAPYLNGEELQIPQMMGDHWYDATVDHATKKGVKDGELTFRDVPTGAFYFLFSPSDRRKLARIFLVNEKGEQLWY